MHARALGLCLLLPPLLASGQGREPSKAPDGREGKILLRVGKILVGDGLELGGSRILIEKGKIREIGDDEGPLPEGIPVVDASGLTAMPGILAALTDLAAADDRYNLTPGRRAVENFDFFAKREKLLKTGLTTVYLSPGRSRLLPGQGSVVKLAGKDPDSRTLRAGGDLRINLTRQARGRVPAVFEPTPTPTSDNPLKPARRQKGSSLISQIQVLRGIFAEARESREERGGEGPSYLRYDLEPLRNVLAGTKALRLAASTVPEILRGLALAEELGARVILERPAHAVEAVKILAEGSVPVLLSLPLDPSRKNPGDWLEKPERLGLQPDAPARLAEAGVPVVLVPNSDAELGRLRLLAGLAARYGLPPDKALQSITLEAARACGVADRVGSLTTGKDADLVLLSGSPFDARSRIEQVWVDGRREYLAPDPEETVAIRAARVLLGDGGEMADATVVLRGKRILDVGRNLPVPAGARRLSGEGWVLMPGLVAAASRLGLHSDSGSGVRAGPEIDVAKHLDPEDPVFEPVAQAGVTTVLVTPEDGGLVSGRITAVKPGGRDFLLRRLAGLRLRLTAGGKAGKAQILGLLKKARDYCFPKKSEAEKKEKKEEPKPKKPAKPDPVTGLWKGTIKGGPMPRPVPFEADLELSGKSVSGTFKSPIARNRPLDVEGSFENGILKLSAEVMGSSIVIEGKVVKDSCEGRITGAPFPLSFRMRRVEGPEATSPAEGDGSSPASSKKKGKEDPKLEPFRPILEKKTPLVCRVANRDAAQAAVDAIVKESGLRLVLTGAAREIAEKPLDLPEGAAVGFLIGPEEIGYEEKGEWKDVAGRLAENGLLLCLVTRSQLGTRYLSAHAAWAVAQGLDPRLALRAVTSNPAKVFGLDKRVGRIAPGRDGDLLLLSGDPFDLTTRVLAVWNQGRLVLDARKER